MFRPFLIAVAVAGSCFAATPAVFTSAQAAAGRTAFNSICSQCHTDRLTGLDGTGDIPPLARPFHGKIPPLAGSNAAFPPFLTKWGSRSTKALSTRIQVAIGGFRPKDSNRNTYLDIAAYVLQVNGAQPGSQPLTADTDAMIRSITTDRDLPLLPAARQNALVGKYCAVCHNDKFRNGGLSLDRFDAAHLDPGLAAMMFSKLNGGAMGASGLPLPDRNTQDALSRALAAESFGSHSWTIEPQMHTASIVEEAPGKDGAPDLYRLMITCRADTHASEMQLTWSPGVPPAGREMTVAADAGTPAIYKVDGNEPMPIGGTSAPGALILDGLTVPTETLTIANLFGGEKVVFPIGDLARQSFAACSKTSAGH